MVSRAKVENWNSYMIEKKKCVWYKKKKKEKMWPKFFGWLTLPPFCVTSRRIRVHSAVAPGFLVCSSDKRAPRDVGQPCCRLVSQKSKDVPRLRWHEAIFSDAHCSWKSKSRVYNSISTSIWKKKEKVLIFAYPCYERINGNEVSMILHNFCATY